MLPQLSYVNAYATWIIARQIWSEYLQTYMSKIEICASYDLYLISIQTALDTSYCVCIANDVVNFVNCWYVKRMQLVSYNLLSAKVRRSVATQWQKTQKILSSSNLKNLNILQKATKSQVSFLGLWVCQQIWCKHTLI